MRSSCLAVAAAAAALWARSSAQPCLSALPPPPATRLSSCWGGSSTSVVAIEPVGTEPTDEVISYCGAASLTCNEAIGDNPPCTGLAAGTEVRLYGPFTAEAAGGVLEQALSVGIIDRIYMCAANDCNSEAAAACTALSPSASSTPQVTPGPCAARLPTPAAEDLTCFQGQNGFLFPGGPPDIQENRYCLAYTRTNETSGQKTRSYAGMRPAEMNDLWPLARSPEFQVEFGDLHVCTTNLCNSVALSNCFYVAPTPASTPSGSPSGSASVSTSPEPSGEAPSVTPTGSDTPSESGTATAAATGSSSGSAAAVPVTPSATAAATSPAATSSSVPAITTSPAATLSSSPAATSSSTPAVTTSPAATLSSSSVASAAAAASSSGTAAATSTVAASATRSPGATGLDSAPSPGSEPARGAGSGAAVGGAVGGVAVVLLLVGGVWYYRKGQTRGTALRSLVSPHSGAHAGAFGGAEHVVPNPVRGGGGTGESAY